MYASYQTTKTNHAPLLSLSVRIIIDLQYLLQQARTVILIRLLSDEGAEGATEPDTVFVAAFDAVAASDGKTRSARGSASSHRVTGNIGLQHRLCQTGQKGLLWEELRNYARPTWAG